MDGQKMSDDQSSDLVIDKDGSMNTDTATPATPTKIMVNDITPPPAPSSNAQGLPEAEELKDEDVASVNEAVKAVTGSDEESVEVATPPTETAPDNEVVSEPVVTEPAPEETSTDQTDESNHVEAPESNDPAPVVKEQEPSPVIAAAMEQPAQTGEVVMGVAASQIAANAAKPPHRNNKKFAALVTILVAVLLSGTAVYVYMSANKNTKETDSNTANTQQAETQTETTPATTADVDQTVTEIEESVNGLDDSADLNEEDLSDTTLGL